MEQWFLGLPDPLRIVVVTWVVMLTISYLLAMTYAASARRHWFYDKVPGKDKLVRVDGQWVADDFMSIGSEQVFAPIVIAGIVTALVLVGYMARGLYHIFLIGLNGGLK